MRIGRHNVIPRRDLEEQWVTYNPVPFDKEPTIATDTEQIRIGDGKTHWVDLPVATPEDVYDLVLRAAGCRVEEDSG